MPSATSAFKNWAISPASSHPTSGHAASAAAALRPYRITCAGLEYIALATGACQAIADAITLHGAQTITAKPLRLAGGAA